MPLRPSFVYYFVAECEFACIQTMAGMTQCLAMVFLAMQIFGANRSQTASAPEAHGLSANSLVLHSIAFACRLSSTTWLNGYLPVDASGDWIYQAFDVLALLIAVGLTARRMAGRE